MPIAFFNSLMGTSVKVSPKSILACFNLSLTDGVDVICSFISFLVSIKVGCIVSVSSSKISCGLFLTLIC